MDMDIEEKHKAIAIPVSMIDSVPMFLTVRDRRFREWLFVTGGCRKKEVVCPLKCALRELEEEIGYRANKITFLAHIHPAIGFANELMSIFLAEDLEKTKDNRDKDEFLELIPTKLDVAVDLVWENKITDVKSIVGLLWLQKIKNGS